ncbi:pectate lyase family protein [Sphingobacterium bovistauri]|uniref:Pectate lyase n=1 Tax=Sphingobacterium bovistauri TaxID=2781959 RepID=A0ABS7Z117_9SPHI|nr:hypothetical protein [Sphingobacterium bovistauri]MCA5003862.1 hypothetical protein [Sphingobacterium bovistauri]
MSITLFQECKRSWALVVLLCISSITTYAQEKILAFPQAEGFGKYALGARGYSSPSVYFVTNLNDSGQGSFRDAVSKAGRFVIFRVSGIIHLKNKVTIAPNLTIAGHSAPGDGVVLYGRTVSFSGANHTIARHLRIRLGKNGGATKNEDASGISNGHDIMLDHISFCWGLDEVFSVNWDKKGPEIDRITLQNCIIGQGLHFYNHSAGSLIQSSGKISIVKSLYISNKTRNPKVKGNNEFVNNVVYNFGNANRVNTDHQISANGYILADSQSPSKAIIVNNYFIAGPSTPKSIRTPFSRGNSFFNLFEEGNYFDNNYDGKLNGNLIQKTAEFYPGLEPDNYKSKGEYTEYPSLNTTLTAKEAFDYVSKNVGALLPKRDEVDQLMINDLLSLGKSGHLVNEEGDLPLINGGLGNVNIQNPLLDTDEDGIPDIWETKLKLDPNNPKDALEQSNNSSNKGYLNIEVYLNLLGTNKTST